MPKPATITTGPRNGRAKHPDNAHEIQVTATRAGGQPDQWDVEYDNPITGESRAGTFYDSTAALAFIDGIAAEFDINAPFTPGEMNQMINGTGPYA